MKNYIKIIVLLAVLSFISCTDGNYSPHNHDDGGGGTVVINYNANGANSGAAPAAHGSDRYVQNNTGHLEKNGYVFDGWNSSPYGSGTDFIPGSSCPSKSMTLYAKWSLVFNYNISSSMHAVSKTMGSAPASGSYLHITGLTQRGNQLAELNITETIDGVGVTSIKADAFRANSNARKVSIAGSVRSIGDRAFSGCSSLETLLMKGKTPPDLGVGVLDFCPAVISVPPDAKEAYSNKAGWSSYSTRIVTYYTITFRSEGASIAAYPTEKQVVYPATAVDSLPSDPVRSGYIFGGWYTKPNGAGTLFTANTEVTSDLTVYAKWIPVSQNTGTRLNFSIISFKDARMPSHLFQNITPALNATYYYKAVPKWTSDLTSVVGATGDFVQLPYNYSIETRTIDMGLFTPGVWDFTVRVVSSNGITLYEKKVRNCKIDSQSRNIGFVLEKYYEGIGALQINALADAVNNNGNMTIAYEGFRSGCVVIPMSDSIPGDEGTVTFKKTLYLPPGFYYVHLTLYDNGKSRAVKSGFVEVFGKETSVLNCTVYRDTWMAEGYTDIGLAGGLFLADKEKLGIVISTNGNIHSRTWVFKASQTEDSEKIKFYEWYVNGDKQNGNGSELILHNLTPGEYNVNCIAFDNTLYYIVGAGISIPVQ